MSTLEREIIEKYRLLQPAAKQRVRDMIAQDEQLAVFDYERWFNEVETLRIKMRSNGAESMDVVDMLRDIRSGIDE
jgi:hypothetical protein